MTRSMLTVPLVLISYVLRLRQEQLSNGLLVGEIEHVETSFTQPVRSAAELVACCQRAAGGWPSKDQKERSE